MEDVDTQAAVLIRQGFRELAAAIRELANLKIEHREAYTPNWFGQDLQGLVAFGLDRLSDLEITDLRIGLADFSERLEEEVQRRRMAGDAGSA